MSWKWLPLGEVVGGEIEARVELADGELVAWPGTCPVCARLPLGDAPVVCEHGVAARGPHGV